MQKKRRNFLIVSGIVLAAMTVTLIVIWVKIQQQGYGCATNAMGTAVRQTVYGKNRVAAASAAANSVTKLEGLLSWKVEDSDVAKLNSEAGVVWSSVDSTTVQVLATALDVADRSGGAYDPTILPLSSLWDFGGENQHVPSAEQIQKFLPFVNYKDLRIDTSNPSASLKLHAMAIDLDGIERGAACDQAVGQYRSQGAEGAVIAVGESIGVYGGKPDHTAWHVAVRDPEAKGNTAMGQVDLTSGFLSTTGVFQSNFTKDGVFYHSILDPKTGYPAKSGLKSVTVAAKSGVLSDALSRACFLLGVKKGESLLKAYGAEGIFIDNQRRVFVTDGMRTRFTVTASAYRLQ